DAFWIAKRLGSEFLTPKKVFDETLAGDRQAILDAYVARQTHRKVSAAPSPVFAPPELLDDDTPDEVDETFSFGVVRPGIPFKPNWHLDGCRREQVTRELLAMAEEGLIEKTRGALILLQPLVLEKRLDEAMRERGERA